MIGEFPHKEEDSMRQTHKQLQKEGWLRQFVADEAQAKDVAETYDLLGYEVHLQPLLKSHTKKGNPSSSNKETKHVQ